MSALAAGADQVARHASLLWRSLLYVPANVEKFIERAPRSGADAIQLDLEDSIAPSEKASARGGLAAAAERIAAAGMDVVVRINRPLSLAVRDIEAAVGPSVKALSLPKVESADHVRLLSETVAEAELRAGVHPGTTRFILGIESPSAFLRMAEIASADPRNTAMLLGSEDFATAVGMSTAAENLLGPKQALVIAAAAADLLPLGIVGSFANFRDTAAFQAMVQRSRAIGYRGSSCIHPDQIPILNREFAPSESEISAARAVMERFEQALSGQAGAIALDGAMIDLPVVERARATLAQNDLIIKRDKSRAG